MVIAGGGVGACAGVVGSLSGPLVYGKLVFSAWQRTPAAGLKVLTWEPGDYLYLKVDDIDGQSVDEWVMVVGKEVARVFNRAPTITLYVLGLGVTTTPVIPVQQVALWDRARWDIGEWQ